MTKFLGIFSLFFFFNDFLVAFAAQRFVLLSLSKQYAAVVVYQSVADVG